MVAKVISGGQTGADIGGLVGALRAGIMTGGMAPKGWKTEVGEKESVLRDFGLTECQADGYPARTSQNVMNADLTVLFVMDAQSPGTKIAIAACQQYGRPFVIINAFQENARQQLVMALTQYRPQVLNVGGNRESKAPGIASRVASLVHYALTQTR